MPLEVTSIHQIQKFPMARPVSSSIYDQKKTSFAKFPHRAAYIMMSMISYFSTKSTVAFSMSRELFDDHKFASNVPVPKFSKKGEGTSFKCHFSKLLSQ
ncbi:LOW QUALITY PROTEIN: hypothetical protein PanWU01x14_218760 [Parasponia andersonii]|uniref:Uncharacterized protein n=1 Tax=Parasponia andersonii TaxID=3476 RepID=A0A2P5BQU8_PARAD|nr:LOW QUALITY PROTEIN: hypothetical protein PanWU01x14_218760 [Parasponia andersonii]